MTRGRQIEMRRRFDERLDEKETAYPRWRALLGDGAGNLYPDPTDLSIVYARRTGRGRIDRVRNTRIMSRHNLPVIVGFTTERPHELQVLEEDTAVMQSMGTYGYVRRHGAQHSLFDPSGGDDTVWVWGQQFLPFLVQETDPISLQVDVRGGHYVYDNEYRTFGGGISPDLSTYAPGVGLAVMLHIVVDASSGTLDYIQSADFSSALPENMRESMIPMAPEGSIPCGAIYIPNGITEVTWDYIYDTRPFVQSVQSGGPHQILSVTHTDTSPEDLVRGDLLAAIADESLARLAAGLAYQFLHMDATGDDPEWRSFDWDYVSLAAGADMVHDHSNNTEGGGLVVGTTDTDATPGSILFAGVAGVLQEDNTNLFWDDTTDHLGVGTNAPGNTHVNVRDATLTSAATFYGIQSYHIKTAGAGAPTDDYFGIYSLMSLDQNGVTIDDLYGGYLQGDVTDGTADYVYGGYSRAAMLGASGIAYRVVGLHAIADIDTGTVTDNVYGAIVEVDTEAAPASIGGDIYGLSVIVDDDSGAGGTVYMVYLNELTGIDYGIYQNGTAPSYFGGSVTAADFFVPDGGQFGIDGNELLTVNAAGTFAFSGISGITVEDADWIGNGAASARLGFNSAGAIDYAYLMGCNVGIGIATPGNVHLYVYDNALNSATSFYGIRNYHVKTAGAGAAGDDYYGIYSYIRLDQATTIDNLYGGQILGILTQGTADIVEGCLMFAQVGGGTVNVDVRAFEVFADVNAGTVTGNVYGLYAFVDIEAAVTSIGGNVYGARIWVDADTVPVGTVYMLYLAEQSNIDYGVYQSGSAENRFGGVVNANPSGLRTITVTDNVSNPPTDAELDAAFGTPAAVGDGFIGLVDDNGAGTTVWLCAALNGSWWYEQLSAAV